MNYQKFYRELFQPVEATLGAIDRDTLVAIIGFDADGPLNFCTIGRGRGERFVTYVSCELAVRPEQQPSEFGRFELLMTCDDEEWCRSILSDIGRMSLEVAFGDGHTLNIGPWRSPNEPIQGVVFEKFATAQIDGEDYAVLRCIGITRNEMDYVGKEGLSNLIAHLKKAGVYPNTPARRHSVV